MKDLLEAFTIFAKYIVEAYPTCCEHDVLYVHGAGYNDMSGEDAARLVELGFDWDPKLGSWRSYRFGSA